MKRVLLILLAVVLGAALVASAVTLAGRDESDAVGVRDARDRATERARTAAEGPANEAPGLRPKAGTYEYEGSGRESVETLGGSEHEFPAWIPVNVELHRGCEWTLALFYVEQHTERRRHCTNPAGIREVRFSRAIEFFGSTDRTRFECDRKALRWQRDAQPGTSWTYTCTGSGRTLDYTISYAGPERVEVGGRQVPAHHVVAVTKLSGASKGSDRSEYWYAESGLPLRWTTDLDVDTDSVIGETRFREKTSYRLRSLEPK